ncbi:hypothetical protein GYMLUDRAFT_84976 [Collybiopsis luxurians FD-317 M1]|uniref:electron-transferring-flavoprotein dehydrogenase n=1 Tax=Collybiopsis luxurians FD-317 M1 TaxID=944289 RepID=A0A0D0CYF6_9AGAR|nr:hypothetical protein GYMLUDRAFT_84976 [Collybiopsis luxurians FD-317 M1]
MIRYKTRSATSSIALRLKIPREYPRLSYSRPSSSNSSTPRSFSTSSSTFNSENSAKYDPRSIERVEDQADVCIVGAGPAGLSAAIRIKQLEREAKEKGELDESREIRVVVLEKGSEVGAHILSGAVLEPRGLIQLLGQPETYEEKYGSAAPLGVPATSSRMIYLTGGADKGSAIPIPHPPQMGNKGNYVISLSALTRWLASIAEEHYGVEIYPGFAGASLVYSDTPDADDPWTGWEGRWGTEVTKIGSKSTSSNSLGKVPSVLGVCTNDVGISKSNTVTDNFEPGMFFRARVTLLAEGAHGSLTKAVIAKYGLRNESDPQTYGFGLKEVWRIAPEDKPETEQKYKPGEVVHTLGFPLDANTYGGGWLYHMDKGLVSIGYVVGADWENPWRSPYRDFQMMKHHPYFRDLLTSSSDSSFTPTRIAYGARVLNEGGVQSLPLLHFPGGALVGDSAGVVNVAKIKGIHNSMGTGILGGEGAWKVVKEEASEDASVPAADLSPYTSAFTKSWVYSDLHEIRNLRPSFNLPFFKSRGLGLFGGVAYSGIDSLILKGRTPWTFRHTSSEEERVKHINASPSLDSAHTGKAASAGKYKEIKYPPFQPPLSTDLLTSVMLTGTSHEEDQPEHLRVFKLGEWDPEAVSGATTEVLGSEAGREVAEGEGERGLKSEQERRREHVRVNVGEFAGLLGRACPAGVYEYVDDEASKNGNANGEGWEGKKLVINAQNCIHCKLCDVKVPTQDITWTVPEGGGGPKYSECSFGYLRNTSLSPLLSFHCNSAY